MPHKTKKEKIIAKYRRQLKLLQENQNNNNIKIAPDVNKTAKQRSIILPEEKSDSKEDFLISSYFISDLKKSLFIIAIIITVEFLLYFASINNYLKLGH